MGGSQHRTIPEVCIWLREDKDGNVQIARLTRGGKSLKILKRREKGVGPLSEEQGSCVSEGSRGLFVGPAKTKARRGIGGQSNGKYLKRSMTSSERGEEKTGRSGGRKVVWLTVRRFRTLEYQDKKGDCGGN